MGKTNTSLNLNSEIYQDFKVTCLKKNKTITGYLEELMKFCNDKRKAQEFTEFVKEQEVDRAHHGE